NHGWQRSRTPGTEIHDTGRARRIQRRTNQWRDRPMQRDRRLDEMQIVGRQIADDGGTPRLIFDLEQVKPAHVLPLPDFSRTPERSTWLSAGVFCALCDLWGV